MVGFWFYCVCVFFRRKSRINVISVVKFLIVVLCLICIFVFMWVISFLFVNFVVKVFIKKVMFGMRFFFYFILGYGGLLLVGR